MSKIKKQGLLISFNGNRYEGDFVDNKRTGQGTMIRSDGSSYKENFVDGEINE